MRRKNKRCFPQKAAYWCLRCEACHTVGTKIYRKHQHNMGAPLNDEQMHTKGESLQEYSDA